MENIKQVIDKIVTINMKATDNRFIYLFTMLDVKDDKISFNNYLIGIVKLSLN